MAERQVEVNELKFRRRDRWDLSVNKQILFIYITHRHKY